jgi:hypothetical protein
MPRSMFERSWKSVVTSSVDSKSEKVGYIRISSGRGSGESLSSPVIFTAYQGMLREKVQALETFNEFVHVYCFGRAVGQATLSGRILATDGTLDAFKDTLLDTYENTLRARKLAENGALAIISGPGGAVLQGVVTQLSFSVSSEGGGGDNAMQFTLQLLTAGGRESPISASGVS